MRAANVIVLVGTAFVVGACSSGPHAPANSTTVPASHASSSARSSSAQNDYAATRAWVLKVKADVEALRGQAANLQYDWNGVLGQGSQSNGYAAELDQIAFSNVQPDAVKLARLLQTAGSVSPVDARYQHDFEQTVQQWQRVAALAHAIKTTAQTYHSDTKTADAITAFEDQLASTESLWNSTVTTLWTAAGVSPLPTVNSNCAPTDKAACNP